MRNRRQRAERDPWQVWIGVACLVGAGCSNPPPPAQPIADAGVDAVVPNDARASVDADTPPIEERGADAQDAANDVVLDAGVDRANDVLDDASDVQADVSADTVADAVLDVPSEAAVDVPVDAMRDLPDVPSTSDAGLVVRGGIGSLGPRGWSRGPTSILDDGFEFTGSRACAGTLCVTGGFVQ